MKSKNYLTIIIAVLLILSYTELSAQEFKLRGRVHMDLFYGIDNADAFSNGFNNRAARIGATGKLGGKWDGMVEADFADGVVSLKDVRLRRSIGSYGRLLIGQFKVPQGLNELTSGNDITFVERSSANNAFIDGRRMGIAAEYSRDKAGITAMVFGRAIGGRSQQKGNMPLGLASRFYLAPRIGEALLHVGASAAWVNFPDTSTVLLRDRPEAYDSKGGSVRFIDTEVNYVTSTFKTGLEILFMTRGFTFESELNRINIKRFVREDANFWGYHMQAGYVFKGNRSYNKGILGGVRPAQGGAWEIALRYSNVDLNDNLYPGGEQKNITLGVNYYVNPQIRFMANIIRVQTDFLDESPLLGIIRAQYSF